VLDKPIEQSVLLKQSPVWSRAIALGIVGVTGAVVLWASVARIEEAVSAQGKLEPEGKVAEVQAPLVGVVREIAVKEGQRVKQGDRLIRLDSTATQAQQKSLRDLKAQLEEEILFYQAQLNGQSLPSPASLSPAMASLARNRAQLASETELFRAQLAGSSGGFSGEQQLRLAAGQAETQSRIAAAELETEQLRRQISLLDTQVKNALSSQAVEQRILNQLSILVEEGGFAQLQYLRQQQEVQNRQAEVDRLRQEQRRIEASIAQSSARVDNTIALTQQETLNRIAANERAIAEIDSQISRAILDNQKRITEIDGQLSQNQVTLRYQDISAPVSGTVFNLQPTAIGFVTNTTTPVLKIVPDDALVAQVIITNRDIGFVREGMPVDVRIDSFPFSEFGDIKGQVIWVGSDALPPTPDRPFYAFPAKIRLDQQQLQVNDRLINLQSGMSVSVNIKIRQRPVISIFTDLFVNKTDNLKQIR